MDKLKALCAMGCLNVRAEAVVSELFRDGGKFFDARDKLQVKYEMLRAVQVDGKSVTEVARAFGLSRETYYTVVRHFELEGCVGLLDQGQGRRQPDKLTPEIVQFILDERWREGKHVSGYRLAEKVIERFHVPIHPRTVYKLLKKRATRNASGRPRRRRGTT